MKILILDKCKAVRGRIDKVLDDEDEGYEIYHAENGWGGLDILKRVKDIDVVIIDVHLPEVDGLTFVEIIKKSNDFNNLKVIFITTENCPKVISRAKKLGISAWIPKPLRSNLLLRVIERIGLKKELMA
ncbi:MAG: response regulator [Bdellovibrionota bacterium]|nr:response regulator [Bdellovibrionota bacterium]